MFSARRDFLRILGLAAAAEVAAKPASAAATFAVRIPVEPTRAGDPAEPIRLANNENAYGPSDKVVAAMRSAIATANRYPESRYDELVQQIAQSHGVKPEQVIIGCGSTEVLQAAVLAFLGEGKKLVQASPTYEAVEYYARSCGAEVVAEPLTRRYAHDLDAMLGRVDGATGLVYICNPNNPTASVTPREDVEKFVSRLPSSCCILVDEAYHHYARQTPSNISFLDRPLSDDRIIVIRSFSHVYGLAGLRVGYGIASVAMVKRMSPHMPQYNVNGIAIRAASEALRDTAGIQHAIKRNANDRQEFFNQAMARAMKPIDSHANFVMMNTYYPAAMIVEHFRKHNILIGPVFPPMDTYIRVSLGTPGEMEAFWRAFDMLPIDKSTMHH